MIGGMGSGRERRSEEGRGKGKERGRGEGAIARTGPSMVLQLVLQSKWVILILGE